jgi:ketosteroid isomerase-like protein
VTGTRDEDEIAELSDRYEAALLANDVEAMNDAFWRDEGVLRFGIADRQRGFDEIVVWRADATPVPADRRITSRVVAELAPGVVAVDLTFVNGSAPGTGRQSQTWVRTNDGWRIVRAHVSMQP